MKEYQIESEIIAYLDGRLNDADSAELMHRVSISPEIRELFQEHEALRQMAFHASKNVSVPAELDDAVFANVLALKQAEDRVAAPVMFWTVKRVSVMAAAVALIVAGTLGSLEFASKSPANVALTSGSSNSQLSIAQASMASEINPVTSDAPTFESAPNFRSSNSGAVRVHHMLPATIATQQKDVAAENAGAPQTESAIAMAPLPRSGSIKSPNVLEPSARTLRDLFVTDGYERFEVGADLASSFVTPGSVGNLAPFDFRLRAAYNLDDRNQIGVRVARSPYSDVAVSRTPNNSWYSASEAATQHMSEELFYEHRFPVDNGLFSVSLGAGGGLFDNGWLTGPEAGIRIPVGARMLFGASFLLSYVHQTHTALDDINSPVIYEGKDFQNTLVGRIEYGLSYRF
jgi:anti-sigma factor RsiW